MGCGGICVLYLIVNPVAGHGRCAHIAETLQALLHQTGLPFVVRTTQEPGQAERLAREAAKDGARLVLCAGGDGTALEAARGLCGTQAALGLLPCGTGNDFARTLGLPKSPSDALGALLSGTARDVDVGHINGHPFLNACGAGFDAQTVHAAQRAKRLGRGMLPYLYGVVDTLLHYRPLRMTIQTDDAAPQDRECLLCLVANGRYIGGGMHVAPCARIDDGLLDLIYIDPLPRHMIVRLLPKLIRGEHMAYTQLVHHARVRSARIDCPGMLLQCDGELQTMDRAVFSIEPARLLLQMP